MQLSIGLIDKWPDTQMSAHRVERPEVLQASSKVAPNWFEGTANWGIHDGYVPSAWSIECCYMHRGWYCYVFIVID